MAIRGVVTRGYGPGATIPLVVLRGYVSKAATATIGGKTAFTEAEVVSGGQVTTITLVNNNWVIPGSLFNSRRQIILDGFNSAQSEITGWNKEVRDKEVVGSVVRTSNTVVTITWTAAPAYNVSLNEVITVTVPDEAVTGTLAIVATPTMGVTADAAQKQFHTINFSAEDESMLFSSEQRSMTFGSEAVSIVFQASDLTLSAILKEDSGRLMTEDGFRILKEQT